MTTNQGKTTTIVKEKEGMIRKESAKERKNVRKRDQEIENMKGVTKDTKDLGRKSEEKMKTGKIEIGEILTNKIQGRREVPEKNQKNVTKKRMKKIVIKMTKASIRSMRKVEMRES